jgi:(2R)-3-sulfolactate dehydrogenase (NADP+)
MRLTPSEVELLVSDALQRCNTSAANAAIVAQALISAELAGQNGHGLRRVVSYAGQASSGKVDGHAIPTCVKSAGASLQVDAANGFAYPALDLAVSELLDLARSSGIAAAGIFRSHHCGVAGSVVEKLADAGLVGLMFANTPAAMAPWGGNSAVFGTNPIAFAAPTANGAPIVVDVSLSKVARGKIMAAKQAGTDIPADWALDSSGNPTTDPAAALAGTMVPMGDAKGTVLALMVELLAAGLTGSNFAFEASDYFSASGQPPATGQCLIAIDPAAFGGAQALSRFAVLADAIETQSGARVPGARRQEIRRELTTKGIAVDAMLIQEIQSLGS